MNDVADVEQADAGDAIKRRDQRGIAEQGLRVLDRSLINFDLRVELVDGSLLIVDLLLRDGIGFRSCSAASSAAHFSNVPDRVPGYPAPDQAGLDMYADRSGRAARLAYLNVLT